MNRRSFLAAAISAVLAPSALINLEMPGATNIWWSRGGKSQFPDTVAGMERLWRECMRYPAPDLILVDHNTYDLVRKHCPELFA